MKCITALACGFALASALGLAEAKSLKAAGHLTATANGAGTSVTVQPGESVHVWIASPGAGAGILSAVDVVGSTDVLALAGAVPGTSTVWPSPTHFSWSVVHVTGMDYSTLTWPAAPQGLLVTVTTNKKYASTVVLSASSAPSAPSAAPVIIPLSGGVSMSTLGGRGSTVRFFSLTVPTSSPGVAAPGGVLLSWGMASPGVTMRVAATNKYVAGDASTLPVPGASGVCKFTFEQGLWQGQVLGSDPCTRGANSSEWTIGVTMSDVQGGGGTTAFTLMGRHESQAVTASLGEATLPLTVQGSSDNVTVVTFEVSELHNITVNWAHATVLEAPLLALVPPGRSVTVGNAVWFLVPVNTGLEGLQGFHHLTIDAKQPCANGLKHCSPATDFITGTWSVVLAPPTAAAQPPMRVSLVVRTAGEPATANVHGGVVSTQLTSSIVCTHHNPDGTCHDHGVFGGANAWARVSMPAAEWMPDVVGANRTSQYLTMTMQMNLRGSLNLFSTSSTSLGPTASSSVVEARRLTVADALERLQREQPEWAAALAEEVSAGRLSLGAVAPAVFIGVSVCGTAPGQSACSTALRFPVIAPFTSDPTVVEAVNKLGGWENVVGIPSHMCQAAGSPDGACVVSATALLATVMLSNDILETLRPLGMQVTLQSSRTATLSPGAVAPQGGVTTAVLATHPAPAATAVRGGGVAAAASGLPWSLAVDPVRAATGSTKAVLVRAEACEGSTSVKVCSGGNASTCGEAYGAPWGTATPDHSLFVDVQSTPSAAVSIPVAAGQGGIVASMVQSVGGAHGQGRVQMFMGDPSAGVLGVSNRTLSVVQGGSTGLDIECELPAAHLGHGTSPRELTSDLAYTGYMVPTRLVSPQQLGVLLQGSYCGANQVLAELQHAGSMRGGFTRTTQQCTLFQVLEDDFIHDMYVILTATCQPGTLCSDDPVLGEGVVYKPYLLPGHGGTGSDDQPHGNDDDGGNGSKDPGKPHILWRNVAVAAAGVVGGILLLAGVLYYCCRKRPQDTNGAYSQI